jgi:amidase
MNTQIQVTAVERVKACLKRIKEIEPAIHAWEFLDGDAALGAAAEADALRSGKPLHGWVFGIKDNHDTGDMPTGYGSPIYSGNRPVADASVVSMLRSNGAVVLGKTVSTEFAAWTPSRTRNPRNISHTPGGSSSGSAAAVAARMVPVALGTQTLGSVIRPASYCGIVGFKPSYGRISRVGIRSLADSLDTVGIFSNTVAEAAHVYRVAADQSEAACIAAPGAPPRLMFCKGPSWENADSDARRAIFEFSTRLRGCGYAIDEIELPPEFSGLTTAAKAVHDFELRQGFLTEYLHHSEQFSESFRTGFERASQVSSSQYERAIKLGETCRQKFPEILGDLDAVITLAATGEAPWGNTTTGDSSLNSPWTLLHAPCITLPKLHGRLGLPIGVQLVAPRFKDTQLLRAAAWLESL